MVIENLLVYGDSFTWGEGLELYLNTPKWISQRSKKSEWCDLYPIQDSLSIGFREFNRYPNIVSRFYNLQLFTDPNNGGSIQSLIRNLFQILNSNIENSLLIIQFSSFTRNLIHTHNVVDENLDCPCDFCMHPDIYKKSVSFYDIFDILERGTIGETKRVFLKKYIEKTHLIDFDNKFEALQKLREIENEYYKLHLNYFINKFIIPFKKRNIETYFIDSWEYETSNVLKTNDYFNQNTLNLLGFDGKEYNNYIEWENTFPYFRIKDEFPSTQNSHPTLIQHQYLANSIINLIKKINK